MDYNDAMQEDDDASNVVRHPPSCTFWSWHLEAPRVKASAIDLPCGVCRGMSWKAWNLHTMSSQQAWNPHTCHHCGLAQLLLPLLKVVQLGTQFFSISVLSAERCPRPLCLGGVRR